MKEKYDMRCPELEVALTPLEIASQMTIDESKLERIEESGYPKEYV